MARKPLAAIISAGCSKFGVLEGKNGREIFAEAAKEAFVRCPNLSPKKDIKALYLGNFTADTLEHQAHLAPLMAEWTGLNPLPATRVEDACASSGVALRTAIFSLMSGAYDVVMVGGVEKMTSRSTAEVTESLSLAADHNSG